MEPRWNETPEGQRARGRLKTTLRRTVEKEWNKAGRKSCFTRQKGRSDSYAPTGATRQDDNDDDDDDDNDDDDNDDDDEYYYYYFSIHMSVADLNKQLLLCA